MEDLTKTVSDSKDQEIMYRQNRMIIARAFALFNKQITGLHSNGSGSAEWDYRRFESGLKICQDLSPFIGYINKVVAHKVAVYNEGVRLYDFVPYFAALAGNREDWKGQLEIHDVSKFSAIEVVGYGNHDFSSKGWDQNFDVAWNHHKHENSHHPEHWFSVNRDGSTEVLPIPNVYIAEMFADWHGASLTYGTPFREWILKNFNRQKKPFIFHPTTAIIVRDLFTALGFVPMQIWPNFDGTQCYLTHCEDETTTRD